MGCFSHFKSRSVFRAVFWIFHQALVVVYRRGGGSVYERRCIRSLVEPHDWLKGSRLHVLIECEREREKERGGRERERESAPSFAHIILVGSEFTKGGGNSSTLRIVCFYHIFFYKVYHFLIYRYVHCYDYICTFLYKKDSLFFMIGFLCLNEGVIYVNFQFLHYF